MRNYTLLPFLQFFAKVLIVEISVKALGQEMKTVKTIWNAITTILVGIIVILAMLLWGVRLLGYHVLIVQSGSMEPSYHVGALVYVKPTDPETLQVGDVITFEMSDGIRGTHRIIEVLHENGSIAFRTKGDANEVADTAAVTPDDIIGKVRYTIPELGFLVTYIQKPPGIYMAVCVVSVLLLLTILPDIIFPDESKKKQEVMK